MSAAALRAEGDSTPASDVTERITKLFPKCRPRTMHRHERLSTTVENRDEVNNINNLSSDDERCDLDAQRVILSAKGDPYKLRDSRIIEIAGGREVYSVSRAKVSRKLRHTPVPPKPSLRGKPRGLARDIDYTADNVTHEMTTLNKLTSNDTKQKVTSPTYVNGDHDPLDITIAIPKSNTPVLDPQKAKDISTKSSPIAVVADGEVVVFDDNEDWKGMKEADNSDIEIDSVKRTLDNMRNGKLSDSVNEKSLRSDASCDGGSESSVSPTSPPGVWSGEEEKRVARVIGELPIAEYEGSPKRYGVGSQLTNCNASRSPRPGFPQRVVRDTCVPPTPASAAAFDYLYEFSETRKVLEEFFRCPPALGVTAVRPQPPTTLTDELVNFQELDYELRRQSQQCGSENGVDARCDHEWPHVIDTLDSPHTTHNHTNFLGLQQREREKYSIKSGNNVLNALSVGAAWSGPTSPSPLPTSLPLPLPHHVPAPFALSPDTSDCDSQSHTLSHSHLGSDLSLMLMENELSELKGMSEMALGPGGGGAGCGVHYPQVEDGLSSGHASDDNNNRPETPPHRPAPAITQQIHASMVIENGLENGTSLEPHVLSDADLHSLDPLATMASEVSPPPPAPAPHRPPAPAPAPADTVTAPPSEGNNTAALRTSRKRPSSPHSIESMEMKPHSNEEDEADTDLETDRLLGQQRTDDQGFFDDKGWRKPKSRTVMPAGSVTVKTPPHAADQDMPDADSISKDKDGKKKSKNKEGWDHAVLIEGVLFRARYLGSTQLACEGQPTKATRMLQAEEAVSRIKWGGDPGPYSGVYAAPAAVFRITYLGSIEVDEDRRRRKRPKKNMVEEAVSKIKAPEGENQPSTEVDLFISTEKIMVLNTELKEIMMDHALRTISYIADIGDLVVLMARRRFVPHESDSDQPKLNRTPKMICHVFESEEAQFIAQSIGQAFQVAYMEFLKANGIEDHSFVKEMDYQEVLNSQEIFGDELQMFAKKELQKEVVVPKSKGEILGVVVVESGWGSMLPTVVIANLAPAGAAARCGHLNIGDQIIAINGVSLVGLPLSTCQTYIKHAKAHTVVKLTVVPCAPVVEVKIKRPDTKYQLGFSVQNGVICSLLRGGIAERGGVRVGHRIIEINSQSVVAVPHERIVNLLATSVGEILMKTMPTSMFRLLTGQENPIFI